jgi:hypothetical protein
MSGAIEVTCKNSVGNLVFGQDLNWRPPEYSSSSYSFSSSSTTTTTTTTTTTSTTTTTFTYYALWPVFHQN